MPTYQSPSQSLVSRRIELSSALAAMLLALPIAALLLMSGALHLDRSNASSFLLSVFFGPLAALAGAFLDARRRQPLGLLLMALGALLAFDGAVATFFLGLPIFLLVVAGLLAGIVAHRQEPPADGLQR